MSQASSIAGPKTRAREVAAHGATVTGAAATGARLVDIYRHWFETVLATTEDLQEQAFQLRYQVYCVENQFEDSAQNPGGKERDSFDAHALQSLLIHRPSGITAGTVRLVLPLAEAPERSFAIQDICTDPLLADRRRFPVERMGEVSRFSISKEFRKRRTDTRYPGTLENGGPRLTTEEERRVVPHMTLGLIESLVRMSVENGLTHWCAIMEPRLLRLLSRLGIYFDPIGPLVAYHGKRQPCFADLKTLLARVREERPDVWDVLTDEGALWERLHGPAGAPAPLPPHHANAATGAR